MSVCIIRMICAKVNSDKIRLCYIIGYMNDLNACHLKVVSGIMMKLQADPVYLGTLLFIAEYLSKSLADFSEHVRCDHTPPLFTECNS